MNNELAQAMGAPKRRWRRLHRLVYTNDYEHHTRLFDWYFDRWHEKCRRSCAAADARYAQIVAERDAHLAAGHTTIPGNLDHWEYLHQVEERYCPRRPLSATNPHSWIWAWHWWYDHHNPRRYKNRLVAFWQRGRRGWADCDRWNFDAYLARLLASALATAAVDSYTFPGQGDADSPEKWQAILAEMAEGFAGWTAAGPGRDDYPTRGDYRQAVTAFEDERMNKLHRSMDLLSEWFPSLWD